MAQADGIIITGRRNFLVRALGFAAVTAPMAALPPIAAFPVITPDLIAKMQAWQSAQTELSMNWEPAKASMKGVRPGETTPDYDAWWDCREPESEARLTMLRAILNI